MKLNKILYILFVGALNNGLIFSKTRLVLSAALADAYFEFRKQQYIKCFGILDKYGYGSKDFYIVEALKKQGPTFLDDYSENVCYAQTNNPYFKNQGTNEARTLVECTRYFGFDPDDMILKLTGRYYLLSDYFLKLVEDHADYDAFVKLVNIQGDVYTLAFAMKCKYLQEMYTSMNYDLMERDWINVEHEVGNYIKRKLQRGNFKVFYVDKLDVEANIFGSTCAVGTPEEILIF